MHSLSRQINLYSFFEWNIGKKWRNTQREHLTITVSARSNPQSTKLKESSEILRLKGGKRCIASTRKETEGIHVVAVSAQNKGNEGRLLWILWIYIDGYLFPCLWFSLIRVSQLWLTSSNYNSIVYRKIIFPFPLELRYFKLLIFFCAFYPRWQEIFCAKFSKNESHLFSFSSIQD